jgi:CPA2 family monovalent cation:H+ antiporter-2
VELLLDLTIAFALSVGAVLISHRVKVPPVVAFLASGVIAGPHVLRIVSTSEQVELLAELGIALLLFVIGLELSLRDLAEIRDPLLVGGSVQMGATALIVGLGSLAMGRTVPQAIFLGLVVSLSSTAVVLKLLQDRAEIESPHGRMVLGTLIFQDLAVVPLMIAAPLFMGITAGAGGSMPLLDFAMRLSAVAVLVVVSFKWVVPFLLHQVVRTRSREAFLLTVLVICMGIALATGAAGLSLALGAFLAGLIISESPYSHQAVSVIMPFRDVFTSLFFVSIGMLVDISFIASHPLIIAQLTIGILLIKPLTAGLATIALGYPLRTGVMAGLALGQIGEFSFLLAEAGVSIGLLDHELFQIVVACAVLSMILTPALMAVAPSVSHAMVRLPLPEWLIRGRAARVLGHEHEHERGHVLVIGFGITGRNVLHAVRRIGLPATAVELNPDHVREGRSEGIDIHYGDATNEAVLRHVHANEAKAIIIAVDDVSAARRIVELARRISPDAFIMVRTRYLRGSEPLYELGADEVIADEVEVSVEIMSRVLARLLVPKDEIERAVADTRRDWRETARPLSRHALSSADLRIELPELRTQSFRVMEGSPYTGHTIAGLGLRDQYGVTVLAVRRDGNNIANPRGATLLEVGDVLFVIGPPGFDPDLVTGV